MKKTMKRSEVIQLGKLLDKYRKTYADEHLTSSIAYLQKQIKKKAIELKDTGYRFFVCKKVGEYIPVAGPYKTLDEANAWMLENASVINEELFGIKAPNDMWDGEIEEVV